MAQRRLGAFGLALVCAITSARAVAAPADAPATSPAQPAAAPDVPVTTEASAAPADGAPSVGDAIYAERVRLFTSHFQQGKVYSGRGNYALAAAEFEKAFAAMPAEAALRNVVVTQERAGDLVAAATAAKQYQQLPECPVPPVDDPMCGSHREEIAADLERLSAQLGELRLEVAKGVVLREVRINGRVRANADFPLWVLPGQIDVELVGGGAQRRQRLIEIRGGENHTIRVDGFDAPTVDDDGGRNPPTGERRNRGRWKRPLFFTGVGLTAASGVALTTTGALTVVADRSFDRQQDLFNENKPPPDQNGEVGDPKYPYPFDEDAQRRRYKKATNILIGVTAGLAVITTIVGIAAFRRRPPANARASTKVRWRFDGAGIYVQY